VEEQDTTEFDDLAWVVVVSNDLYHWWKDKYSSPYTSTKRRERFQHKDPDPGSIYFCYCPPLQEEDR